MYSSRLMRNLGMADGGTMAIAVRRRPELGDALPLAACRLLPLPSSCSVAATCAHACAVGGLALPDAAVGWLMLPSAANCAA